MAAPVLNDGTGTCERDDPGTQAPAGGPTQGTRMNFSMPYVWTLCIDDLLNFYKPTLLLFPFSFTEYHTKSWAIRLVAGVKNQDN